MALTRDVSAINASWTVLNASEDLVAAVVQLKTSGPVLVYVGAVAPANDSIVGMLLSAGELEEVPLNGLAAGDKIFVRSTQDETNTIAAYLAILLPEEP